MVLLNGQCIYVSDASSKSHDQLQWNHLKLRQLFEDIMVGIIGDKGFFFIPLNVFEVEWEVYHWI